MDLDTIVGYAVFALIALVFGWVARLIGRAASRIAGQNRDRMAEALAAAMPAAPRAVLRRPAQPVRPPPPPAPKPRPRPPVSPPLAEAKPPAPQSRSLVGALSGGNAFLRSFVVAEALAPPVALRGATGRPAGYV